MISRRYSVRITFNDFGVRWLGRDADGWHTTGEYGSTIVYFKSVVEAHLALRQAQEQWPAAVPVYVFEVVDLFPPPPPPVPDIWERFLGEDLI